jgi:hypothetical protein
MLFASVTSFSICRALVLFHRSQMEFVGTEGSQSLVYKGLRVLLVCKHDGVGILCISVVLSCRGGSRLEIQ